MKGFASVGDVLAGKYRVDKILGVGGMGMVVRAVNLDLDQRVALKFMLPQALESAEASARFVREARAAGRLTGEHICRVSDIGRFDTGAPYIVMEYLEGYDLMTLLKRRGPLPIAEAIDYILQACEGMAEAHAIGIVHRDLKPDNLFLANRADGTKIVKVLDFGISKAAVTGLATKTGDVLGSPAYMAPEQMQSTKDVDARADIWSLGVVLHQLISGKLAFHGDTLPQLCMAVLNDEPKNLTELRADVPPALAEIVLRCLEKDRDKRFADVGELADALAPFGGSTATGALTRVKSLLRGRQSMSSLAPNADELAAGNGDVLPTLVGDSLPRIPSQRDTPVMRPLPGSPTVARPENTTLSATAGESMQIRRGRVPLGVIGAVVGTLGMVAVIVVMVMRHDGGDERRAASPTPPPAPTVQPAPTVEPIIEPPVEPVEPQPVAPAPAPVVTDDAAEQRDDAEDKRRRKRRDREGARDPGEGTAAPVVTPVDAGVTPPVDAAENEEDKWGRMLDDEQPQPEPAP